MKEASLHMPPLARRYPVVRKESILSCVRGYAYFAYNAGMFFGYLFIGFVAGMGLALQAPTNASLSAKPCSISTYQAGFVSFTGGLILFGAATLLLGSGDFLYAFSGELEPWKLFSGFYGAIIVVSMAFSTPRLGVALALSLNLFSSFSVSMVIDTFGLFGAQMVPLSALRIAGWLLVTVGIGFVYMGKVRATRFMKRISFAESVKDLWLPLLSALVAGVVVACQAPTLQALSEEIGQYEAGLFNFVGGWVILLVITLATQKGKIVPIKGVKPWQLLGGFHGGVTVFCNILAAPVLGIGLYLGCNVFGQLITGMIIDTRGLMRCEKIKLNRYRFIGTIVLLVGVLFILVEKISLPVM